MIGCWSVHVDCGFALVWQGCLWADFEHSERHQAEVSDEVIYCTVAQRWAVGVPTIGVPSEPTVNDVQSQWTTEL